eukprot:8445275-Pyramimonas_sp.AAC.2
MAWADGRDLILFIYYSGVLSASLPLSAQEDPHGRPGDVCDGTQGDGRVPVPHSLVPGNGRVPVLHPLLPGGGV